MVSDLISVEEDGRASSSCCGAMQIKQEAMPMKLRVNTYTSPRHGQPDSESAAAIMSADVAATLHEYSGCSGHVNWQVNFYLCTLVSIYLADHITVLLCFVWMGSVRAHCFVHLAALCMPKLLDTALLCVIGL